MLHKHFYTIFFFFAFLCLTPSLAQTTVVWDESVDGDFPGVNNLSNTEFQAVSLFEGTNLIRGTISNAVFNGTNSFRDAFSFTVPNGASNVTVVISSFVLNGSNSGAVFTGYSGSPLANTNMNPQFFVSASNTNLTNTLWGNNFLPSGQHGLVIGESDIEGLEYEISITCIGCPPAPTLGTASIPSLSEWGLIVLALLLMTLGTLVLVQPDWRREQES